jgi:hypothetical protein
MGFSKSEALPVENVKFAVSKRFLDDNGNPEEWELRCLKQTEEDEIRRSCRVREQFPGRRGQFASEVDEQTFVGKLTAACVVRPNLNDAALQDEWGVKGGDKLLKAMLTPGEYGALLLKVQEVNGYDLTFHDEVDEIKN